MSAEQVTQTTVDDPLAGFPIVDLSNFLKKKSGETVDEAAVAKDCQEIATLLHKYGILIVRDPRVPDQDNERFIDMMEQYFEQSDEVKAKDIRQELSYQVGITPSGIEKARDHCASVAKFADSDKPLTICPPEVDPKCRFFWRIGDRPEQTEFPQLNAEPVIPAAFPQWTDVMNGWGSLMLNACFTVAEMAAVGMDISANSFTNLMTNGPHLLAPTGSDLNKWNSLGTVFANYHYDLNFMTIHGRSRYPGLYIWTREGKKALVRVPQNCLLLQAGKQFEWVTGGYVLAGFHEVVVVEPTLKAIEKSKAEGRSLWRISSTLFSHIASDNVLQPLEKFALAEANEKYPPTKAGHQVRKELDSIKLGAGQIVSM